MEKLQLLFFFLSGFLVSRVLISTRIPQNLVFRLLGKDGLSTGRLLLYLLGASAFLSFFIPNVITVLTLLPVLEALRKSWGTAVEHFPGIPTMLALAVIYGANIGGMGSVTSSMANGILITFLEVMSVPGGEALSYASWLLWGIPLVCIFVLVAWAVLAVLYRKAPGLDATAIRTLNTTGRHPLETTVFAVTALFFLSSLGLSLCLMLLPDYSMAVVCVSAVYTFAFVLFLFFMPFNHGEGNRRPLLRLHECYNDLPIKGFVLVGVVTIVGGLSLLLREQIGEITNSIAMMAPPGLPVLVYFLIVALIASFLTEILSNTVVQLSLFSVALPLASYLAFDAVQLLTLITLSSTCAFMSPLATGVNGLAFGGVRGVSLRAMLFAGLCMNIVGALLLSLWAQYIIGYLYGS